MIRRTRLTSGLAAVVVALAAALAVPPAGRAAPPPPATADPGTWVTLITGDRVLVRPSGVLAVQPAPRSRPARFQEVVRHGDRYLIPADAAGLLRAGTLDWQLFNVTGLVRQGLDDAHAARIPLLIGYAGGARAAKLVAPPGAHMRRALPGVGMTAVDADRSGAFWRELSPASGLRTQGIATVWLNGRAKASLDESVPHIGAPAAWQRGLTGKGVRVAVLDTGIAADHPDLAGKVATAKDFSGKGSAADGNGHGTHVASTVAGSGAAAEGRYRGVAPDATLAVGKVLDDSGWGEFDDILAGMQWAAADAGADVVNMSLGGYGTDGTDPLSAAVNTLSREHGTLFVVAAGNDGADEWVSTPAAADEALAVGSLSKTDVLSEFSNRGPRIGDGAVKPDLAAPGEDIVAARPAGVPPLGEPVGDAYQRLSGTSMATPHVAGTAALLAQQHPEWTGDRLKAALMSTAVPVEGAGPYAVGTGRVDADRATRQAVTATGSVSTYLKWPTAGSTAKRPVTWHNTGTEAVTLELDAALTGRDGSPAPEGLLSLPGSTVTVPAGGSATVDLLVSARDGGAGTYGGVLTARGAGGAVATRTALSVSQEPEMYDLTLNLVDRDGAAVGESDYPSVVIFDLDRSDFFFWGGVGTHRLPAGRYAVHATIETPRAGQEPTFAFITHPELKLNRDATQTLDARDGKQVSVTADNPAARGGGYVVQTMTKVSDCGCVHGMSTSLDPRFHEAYAATVPGTSSSSFAFGQSRRASEADLELFAAGDQRFEVAAGWLSGSPTPEEALTLPVVHAGAGTPEDLAKVDARGKLVLFEVSGETTYEEAYRRTEHIKQAGGRLAMVLVTEDLGVAAVRAAEEEPVPALPTLRGYGPTAARFADLAKAGGLTATYASRPLPKYRYELAYGVTGQVSTAQVHRPRTRDLAAVRTAYHDNAPGTARYYVASVPFFGTRLGGGWSQPTAAGREQVEYFTPGNWELITHGYWGPRDTLHDTLDLKAGKAYRIAWNKAVAGPTFRDGPWVRRVDGAIDAVLPMYGDAAGRPRVPFAEDGTDSGSITLYRDGVEVGTAPVPDAARFPVPDEPGRYRLVAQTRRAVDWWPLWTEVSAAWTFRSSGADEGEPLPLLTTRFDPAVDVRNRAPGGRAFTFPAYVERQDAGAVRVKRFTVDVSYDGGRTWRKAAVTRNGPRWTVTVHHPATGHASLRARVTDAAGNTLEQTVLRAYQIG
ncbi:S8 family serine peptidase [Phytohabitans rumicis]|uniref:Peptidase n=1 Tax=Phytohabitans rumicis TaxID=1076125 RepID=A0A6V8LRE7_9ACTN|nr:S8 family serine peptidase [Phytohabitans rumicis]GFJ95315.1 peptidase [Phytohabitans rumicis]